MTNRPAFGLVAHEISHQWFGDSVTEKDWDDAWLSEGFATYFAALATEFYEGRDAFLETMARSRSAILQMEKKSPIPVIHDNLSEISTGRAPIGLVYQKGGWFLHMLRSEIGRDKFRDGMREYYRRFRDANASTADLLNVMQETSGQELGWFFQQWLQRPLSPAIEGTWSYDAAGRKIVLELTQQQAGEAFRLPMRIAIGLPGKGTKTASLLLKDRTARFEFPSEREPETITLDPGIEVLMEAHLARK